MCMALAASALSMLVDGTAFAAELARVPPARCMPQVADYTYMWWADGWRGRSPDSKFLRCVQTGRYGMALDVDRMAVPHLGVLAKASSYEEAATEDNGRVLGLPPADLQLTFIADGKTYRCVQGGRPEAHNGPRVVESGRFCQRADVTNLVFKRADRETLGMEARFETVAWPDRLTMLLEASPARKELRAGDCFGRVGGGYYFDGKNHIEVPDAPELEPENLTVELWIYIPEGPMATPWSPWVICKNGSEWGEGNYGFMVVNGAPMGVINIGGGRDNMHFVFSTDQPFGHPHGDQALTREKWHHLALTYDGSVLRLYMDGKERGKQAISKKRIPGTGGLAIGRRQDNSGDGYHFRGAVDEVRIYGRALAAEEIAAHFAAPDAIKPDPSLAREWTFDPKGVAAETRPRETWQSAEMVMSLKAGGRTIAERVAIGPEEPWDREHPRTVSLSLVPAAAGLIPVKEPSLATVTAAAIPEGQACPVEYDAARDWHNVNLDEVVAKGEHNDALERVRVKIANPEAKEAAVRLRFEKNAVGMKVQGMAGPTGMSPMLRDLDGNPLGIPVQLSKNWHSQPDRDLTYQGCWLHGLTLLRVPARSQVELEFTLAYAHWGGVAAASHAQLCLIGWGSNQVWDQSAIGCWGESICYEPDQAQAECLICDVRPLMVHVINAEGPWEWGWTNNVGGGDFFRYFDAKGQRVFPARMRTRYLRQCPDLTEVTYAGQSADGSFDHQATVSLWRTNDLTRGVDRLRMDVRKAMDFSRFVVFQVGADTYNYTGERKMAVGNETGLVKEWATQWGGDTYRTPPMQCAGRVPWLSLHEAVSRDKSKFGAWANRGIVIRKWKARLGGKPAQPYAAEHGANVRGSDSSSVDIVPPPDVKRLLPGDYIEATLEHVIMPQFARDYYGPNANLMAALAKDENTWRVIQREAVGNDVVVKVSQGALERGLPARIRATGNRAQFALTGGLGYVPVTISGLTDYRKPVLEMREGSGAWKVVDQAVHGADFWQADHNAASKTWEITYTVPVDTPGDVRVTREFRFRVGYPKHQSGAPGGRPGIEEMICPRTAQAPVVDGVLGDPCSNAVTAVGGFTQPVRNDPPATAYRALKALARVTTSG